MKKRIMFLTFILCMMFSTVAFAFPSADILKSGTLAEITSLYDSSPNKYKAIYQFSPSSYQYYGSDVSKLFIDVEGDKLFAGDENRDNRLYWGSQIDDKEIHFVKSTYDIVSKQTSSVFFSSPMNPFEKLLKTIKIKAELTLPILVGSLVALISSWLALKMGLKILRRYLSMA